MLRNRIGLLDEQLLPIQPGDVRQAEIFDALFAAMHRARSDVELPCAHASESQRPFEPNAMIVQALLGFSRKNLPEPRVRAQSRFLSPFRARRQRVHRDVIEAQQDERRFIGGRGKMRDVDLPVPRRLFVRGGAIRRVQAESGREAALTRVQIRHERADQMFALPQSRFGLAEHRKPCPVREHDSQARIEHEIRLDQAVEDRPVGRADSARFRRTGSRVGHRKSRGDVARGRFVTIDPLLVQIPA